MKIAGLTDAQFELLLGNAASKIDLYAALLGIAPDEVQSLKNDAAAYSYVTDAQDRMRKHGKDWTSYKNTLRSSAKAVNLGEMPQWQPAKPPETVAADITGRFVKLINRLQNHTNYSPAIGHDLGIENISAALTPADKAAMKPVLKIHLVAGQPVVEWAKGEADGLEIHKAEGTGNYEFLDIDMRPHFIDKSSLPTPGQSVVWKYKAIYRLGDERIGQWSDEVSVSVM